MSNPSDSNDNGAFKNTAADPAQMLKSFLEDVQAKEKTKEWAQEATQFIKNNPWAAVLGAAALGYLLGRMNHRQGN